MEEFFSSLIGYGIISFWIGIAMLAITTILLITKLALDLKIIPIKLIIILYIISGIVTILGSGLVTILAIAAILYLFKMLPE